MYVRRHFTILAGVMLLMLAWSFRLDMYSLLDDGQRRDGTFSWVDHQYGIPGNLLLSILTLGAGLIVMWAGSVGQFRLARLGVERRRDVACGARGRARHRAAPRNRQRARDRASSRTRARGSRTRAARLASTLSAAPIPRSAFRRWPPRCRGCRRGMCPRWRARLNRRDANGDRNVRQPGARRTTVLLADVIAIAAAGRATARAVDRRAHCRAGADERGAPLHARRPQSAASTTRRSRRRSSIRARRRSPLFPTRRIRSITPSARRSSRFGADWRARGRFRTSRFSRNRSRSRVRRSSRDRDIRDRVSTLTPFFAQGRSVEPLLVGDSLFWGIDLYSASDMYPLSRRAMLVGEERSYFRHAAVAIVQASTGDISVVPDSSLDPDRVDVGAPAAVDLRNVERAAARDSRPPAAVDRRSVRASQRVRSVRIADRKCSRHARCRRSTGPTRALLATIFRSCCPERSRRRSRCRWSMTRDGCEDCSSEPAARIA